MVKLDNNEAIKISRKLAKYFVYCCGEGEHYVPLIERLREANTRSSLLEAVYILIRYGKSHLKQSIEDINQHDIDNLFQFIRTQSREQVSRLHSSVSTYISNFEVEKIREQERYLIKVLLDNSMEKIAKNTPPL